MPDNTGPKQGNTEFKPGLSGNPKGRPKGARSKLGEAFLSDMYASWTEHGAVALEKVRLEKPEIYIKVVASILPKELNINNDVLGDMTNDELEQYAQILKSIVDRARDNENAPDEDHRSTAIQQ